MNELEQRIDACNHLLGEMMEAMRSIREAARNSGGIIPVIDEIAFRTNVLALNLAVKAAREGEAGTGLAELAGEARTLAQRSAGVAQDAAVLISESLGRAMDGSAKLEEFASAMRSISVG
jgi:methyl-accepting chemotaxis protein